VTAVLCASKLVILRPMLVLLMSRQARPEWLLPILSSWDEAVRQITMHMASCVSLLGSRFCQKDARKNRTLGKHVRRTVQCS